MKSFALSLLLLFTAFASHAGPIVFTTTNYTTSALAGVGGSIDGPDDDSSPIPPITSSASLNTGDGSASATSTASNSTLSAAAEATGINVGADATAVATFTGTFEAIAGAVSLILDFTSLGAGGQLSVILDVGGTTLFNDSFSVTELINQTITVSAALAGLPGILDVTLTSLADAPVGNTASNAASVAFSLNAVPEPDISANLLLGLGLLAIIRRKWGARASV